MTALPSVLNLRMSSSVVREMPVCQCWDSASTMIWMLRALHFVAISSSAESICLGGREPLAKAETTAGPPPVVLKGGQWCDTWRSGEKGAYFMARISPAEMRSTVFRVPTRHSSISVSSATAACISSEALLRIIEVLLLVSKTVSFAYVNITPLNPRSFNCCTHVFVSLSVSPAQNWLYSVRFSTAFRIGLRSTLKSKLRFGFEKNDNSLSDGRRRNLFDDTVAMKSDLRSMCVGMTDSGCSESLCCEAAIDVSLVVSLLFPRGIAVVELSLISNVLRSLPSFPLVLAQHNVDLPSRDWNMTIARQLRA
jgi:hypothetical protein